MSPHPFLFREQNDTESQVKDARPKKNHGQTSSGNHGGFLPSNSSGSSRASRAQCPEKNHDHTLSGLCGVLLTRTSGLAGILVCRK